MKTTFIISKSIKKLGLASLIMMVLMSMTWEASAQSSCPSIACRTLNVSVGSNCMVELKPSELVPDDIIGSSDCDVSGYVLYIENKFGEVAVHSDALPYDDDANQFMFEGNNFVGKTLNVRVDAVNDDGDTRISCWNEITIEDKAPPALVTPECPDPIEVVCYETLDMGTIIKREAFTDCSDFRIVEITSPSIKECDPDLEPRIMKQMTVEAYAIDEFNRRSGSCEFTIDVLRLFPNICVIDDQAIEADNTVVANPESQPELCTSEGGATFLPSDAVVALVNPTSKYEFNCETLDELDTYQLETRDGFITVPSPSENGVDLPELVYDADPAMGVVDLESFLVYPLGTPKSQDLLDNCKVGGQFTDTYITETVNKGCRQKILRRWEIREWGCVESEPLVITQEIEIVDTIAPTPVNLPSSFTASTNGYTCQATARIPEIEYEDQGCSANDGISIDVHYPGGILEDFQDLTEQEKYVNIDSTGYITYIVRDACDNWVNEDLGYAHRILVTVEDLTPPVMVCDDNIVVSITKSGTSSLPATVFDDGSYDDCGLKTILGRRMNPTECDCIEPVLEHFFSLGEYNNRYYFVSKSTAPLEKARKLAEAYGGTFYRANNAAERDEIKSRVESYPTVAADSVFYDQGTVVRLIPGAGNGPLAEEDKAYRYVIEMTMSNACNFSEKLLFCCDDPNQDDLMVVVRAIDGWGNYNECMVRVTAQSDKAPQTLTCPEGFDAGCILEEDFLSDRLGYINTIGGMPADSFAMTGAFRMPPFTTETVSGTVNYFPREFTALYSGIVAAPDPLPEGDNINNYHVRNFRNGSIGYACADDIVVELTVNEADFDQCRTGKLIREFRVYLPGREDEARTCTQTIEYHAVEPFDETKIDFSNLRDTLIDNGECVNLDNTKVLFDTSVYGSPIIPITEGCDMIALQYKDEVFTVDHTGGTNKGDCSKVIRTWSVINWCNLNRNSANGEFQDVVKAVQTFKLTTKDGPMITEACTDTIGWYCTNDIDCTRGRVIFEKNATDVCTDDEELEWSWQVTLEEGTSAISGSLMRDNGVGSEIIVDQMYPVGLHEITFMFTDKCGLMTTCTEQFAVGICKAPSAYCLSKVTLSVTTDGADIWASDLAPNIAAPCGLDADEVILSLSSTDLSVTGRSFTCDDIDDSPIRVPVYFTILVPKTANRVDTVQTSCTSEIELQNNAGGNNPCPGTGNGTGDDDTESTSTAIISGHIHLEDNRNVPNTEIVLTGADNQMVVSSENGGYAFPQMQTGGDYIVSARKEDKLLNGLSTLDIVLIQKHILDLNNLDSPYKIIAADVNEDNKVSSIDIIELRKVLLGISPNTVSKDQWRFIDADFKFYDPSNPLSEEFAQDYNLADLSENMDIQFIGLKKGDVNNSVALSGSEVESRTNRTLMLETIDEDLAAGQKIELPLRTQNTSSLTGYQFTIEFDPNQTEFLGIKPGVSDVDATNFGFESVNDGVILVSWNTEYAIVVNEGESLFNIVLEAKQQLNAQEMIDITGSRLHAEAYDNISTVMSLGFDRSIENAAFSLEQNVPNPFSETTVIGVTMEQKDMASLKVFDLNGRLLYDLEQEFAKGYNEIEISKKSLNASGVLYYVLESNGQSITKRMVVIN